MKSSRITNWRVSTIGISLARVLYRNRMGTLSWFWIVSGDALFLTDLHISSCVMVLLHLGRFQTQSIFMEADWTPLSYEHRLSIYMSRIRLCQVLGMEAWWRRCKSRAVRRVPPTQQTGPAAAVNEAVPPVCPRVLVRFFFFFLPGHHAAVWIFWKQKGEEGAHCLISPPPPLLFIVKEKAQPKYPYEISPFLYV